ncbi:hypothetical protein AABB24_030518, partial [Solanum stoloniferum]
LAVRIISIFLGIRGSGEMGLLAVRIISIFLGIRGSGEMGLLAVRIISIFLGIQLLILFIIKPGEPTHLLTNFQNPIKSTDKAMFLSSIVCCDQQQLVLR